MTATWNSEPLFKAFACCEAAEDVMFETDEDGSTVVLEAAPATAAEPVEAEDDEVFVVFHPVARSERRHEVRSIAVKLQAGMTASCRPNWPGWLDQCASDDRAVARRSKLVRPQWTPGFPLFLAA